MVDSVIVPTIASPNLDTPDRLSPRQASRCASMRSPAIDHRSLLFYQNVKTMWRAVAVSSIVNASIRDVMCGSTWRP